MVSLRPNGPENPNSYFRRQLDSIIKQVKHQPEPITRTFVSRPGEELARIHAYDPQACSQKRQAKELDLQLSTIGIHHHRTIQFVRYFCSTPRLAELANRREPELLRPDNQPHRLVTLVASYPMIVASTRPHEGHTPRAGQDTAGLNEKKTGGLGAKPRFDPNLAHYGDTNIDVTDLHPNDTDLVEMGLSGLFPDHIHLTDVMSQPNPLSHIGHQRRIVLACGPKTLFVKHARRRVRVLSQTYCRLVTAVEHRGAPAILHPMTPRCILRDPARSYLTHPLLVSFSIWGPLSTVSLRQCWSEIRYLFLHERTQRVLAAGLIDSSQISPHDHPGEVVTSAAHLARPPLD